MIMPRPMSNLCTTHFAQQNQSLSSEPRFPLCLDAAHLYDFWTMSDTLLIVDDDPAILTGLQALLEGEWEVRTAESGRDARAAFANFSPDVVLLDVGLPHGHGLELPPHLK